MKADHRKQLEQNELAARLSTWWKGTGEAKKSSTVWVVLGVIVLVAVLIFAWRYYRDSTLRNSANVWKQIEQATGASELRELVNANRGTPVGRAAKAQLARLLLNGGLDKLPAASQRKQAIADVDEARTLYGELIEEAKNDAMLQREAMLASAKAEEALVGIPKSETSSESRGSLERALELYEQTAEKFDKTPQGKEAAERAKDIRENKQRIQQFYEDLNKRFSTFDLPSFPFEPRPKEPVLPTDPLKDLGKPMEPTKPLTPPAGEPKPSEPKPMEPTKPLTPPPGEAKPKDTKPSDPKPSDPKPPAPVVPPPKDPAQPPPKPEPPKPTPPKPDKK